MTNSWNDDRPVRPSARASRRRRLLGASWSVAAPAAEQRLALVIGNSRYHHLPRLANPVNDARLLADTLRRMSFEVTAAGLDLDRKTMGDLLADFSRRAERAAVVVVYYAGHGVEFGGETYLIPVDARLARDKDVPLASIGLSQVLTAVERKNRPSLVILDACRDNPLPSDGRSAAGGSRGLAPVETRAGTVVAYAAKHGTVALDGSGANSPFASALQRHLPTGGVDLRLVFGRVKDDVVAATKGFQEPWIYQNLGGREVPLVSSGGDGEWEVDAPQTEVALGLGGEDWRLVQQAFDELGYYADNIDGIPGPPTREALSAWQTALARPATGFLTGEQVALLLRGPQPDPSPPLPPLPDRDPPYEPGDVFSDCFECPQMVVLPPGSFVMGSPESEPERDDDEQPQHIIQLHVPFAVWEFEVTFEEWQACVKAGACDARVIPFCRSGRG